tara:strand:+ start:5012 stop:5233 length:222 start_codon:yes stop_codon:yes gene_type:complete
MSGTGPSTVNLPSKVSVTQQIKFSSNVTTSLEISGSSNLTSSQINNILNSNLLTSNNDASFGNVDISGELVIS